MRRTLAFLAILLLLGAGAAVAIVATSTSNKAVHARRVIARDFDSTYQQLKSLIDDNTK